MSEFIERPAEAKLLNHPLTAGRRTAIQRSTRTGLNLAISGVSSG